MDRSEYTIYADLDPNNEIAVSDDLHNRNIKASLAVDIPDTSKINPGDFITILTDQWTIAPGDIKLEDGTIIGKLTRDSYLYDGYSISSSMKTGSIDVGAVNQITKDKPGFTDVTYSIAFNENIKNYSDVSFTYSSILPYLATRVNEDTLVTSTIKDAFGNTLDTVVSTSKAPTLLSQEDATSTNPGEFAWIAKNAYDLNTNVNIRSGRLGGMQLDSEKALLPAGSIINYDLNDGLGIVYELVKVHSDGWLYDLNLVEGVATTTDNGIYFTGGEAVKFELVSFENNIAKFKTLSDVTHSVNQVLFEATGVIGKLDETVIDPATGQFLNLLPVGISVELPSGEIVEGPQKVIDVTYKGIWSSGDGEFAAKYVSTLNAVLEDGTVIKQ